jgi:outer membrane receptor protein involved in Fe transport
MMTTLFGRGLKSACCASASFFALGILHAGTASAQVSPAQDQQRAEPAEEQEVVTSEQVGEIVVTAQKRSERLLDVPASVSAVTADTLLKSNAVRLQDYYSSVPGVNLAIGLTGEPVVIIRGVTTGAGAGNPTVGIVVDDVPFGSSTGYSAGGFAPDFDPSDLARIEVLRGPQGTLYGASSIGGLLKFVTVDPSTKSFFGRVQAGINTVRHGSDLGFGIRGSLNLPVSETFALRVSGFARKDPGYIDNPVLGRRDVNDVDTKGGLVAALWKPSDAFSIKLTALHQHIKADGSPQEYVEPGLGALEQDAPPDAGTLNKRITVLHATVTADLGGAELVSVTGYSRSRALSNFDFTAAFGALSEAQFGESGTVVLNDVKISKVSQELRLSGTAFDKLDWLVGGFYTKERTRYRQNIVALDSVTGAFAGEWLDAFWPTTFRELAAFGDLTWHVTDAFNVQVGGRTSSNRQTYSEIDAGPYADLFGLPSPIVTPRIVTKDSSFTYTVTPSLKLTPDLMVYAKLASGYRPGGPNPTYAPFNLPPSFKPDTTTNYEVGIKGTALGRALSFEAAFYYIDWKDIQLLAIDPISQANYYVNASGAKSQGVELSFDARPARGLKLSAWGSWNDAKLTDNLPPGGTTIGSRGDRLPYSSRLSGNVSIDQTLTVANGWDLNIGGAVSYVGRRKGLFTSTPERQTLAAYTKVDLHAGFTNDRFDINFFVNNLTDSRGRIDGGLGNYTPTAFTLIQPRTIGVMVGARF